MRSAWLTSEGGNVLAPTYLSTVDRRGGDQTEEPVNVNWHMAVACSAAARGFAPHMRMPSRRPPVARLRIAVTDPARRGLTADEEERR